MAIEEACGVTRTDCIRQLEHLATEYLDARRLPAIHAFAELNRLDAVATDLVASAWDFGYLICVDDIASKLGISMNLEEMGFWIFSRLVGYNSFEQVPVWEPAYLNDELNLVRKIEVERYHYYLMPGWLQPETGFMEFQRIDLGAHVRDVESRFEAKLSNCFEIMGYRSKACKVMIEMLDKEISEVLEQSVAPVVVPDPQKEIRAEVLGAVVAGGLAGLILTSSSLPAAEKYSKVMRSMCESDEMYYRWSADNWVEHFKAAKKTVTGCDAWGEIMQWREAKKQSAMPVKTAMQKAELSRRKQHKKLAE